MIIVEEQRDLFTVPKEYALAHCISADFALGAGIAKQFALLGVKGELQRNYAGSQVGSCLVTHATVWRAEFNLVTKTRYFNKPTYRTLRQSVCEMKSLIAPPTAPQVITKIAMPRIGCGLDRLDWSKVRTILEEEFSSLEGKILVCIK